MTARFEMKISEAERCELQAGAERTGMSASAIVRFGLRWSLARLDGVLATGGADKTARDIAAFLDEMRADPRLAPMVADLREKIAAMDIEGDTVPSAAALHDMVGLVAAEPLPLPEKIRLLSDLLEFEGRLTIRRLPEETRGAMAAQTQT